MDTSFLFDNRNVADITFLGSHHWKVFGLDEINPDGGDMFTTERQQQLEDLLVKLERYQPTKVMIEWPFDAQDQLDERYQNFLGGTLDIDTDDYVWEGYQIGFKLAKRLGHNRIYGVDNRKGQVDDLPFDQVMGLLQHENLQSYGSVIQKYIAEAQTYMDDVVTKPLIENYKIQNSEHGLWLNQMFYLILAEINHQDEEYGLDLATKWYKRNLGIFTNISSHVDFEKDERILVIFGQGHVPYLIDSVKQSPYYKLTPVPEVLN